MKGLVVSTVRLNNGSTRIKMLTTSWDPDKRRKYAEEQLSQIEQRIEEILWGSNEQGENRDWGCWTRVFSQKEIEQGEMNILTAGGFRSSKTIGNARGEAGSAPRVYVVECSATWKKSGWEELTEHQKYEKLCLLYDLTPYDRDDTRRWLIENKAIQEMWKVINRYGPWRISFS